ncbi:membrane protein [Roseibium aquae]|uniref:Membrane protein n=1 Tax=Roseibium aquae TaxID=1323746 RepID=A0A916TL08_9HYPH|nr:DMT family transporter [Roseibium aquae]GGB54634.1 membrane protein [Roseibium aquae]
MTVSASMSPLSRPAVGIAFILMGMAAISVNDMLIKALSGGYPLHQSVFIRSAIGMAFSLVFVQLEGGFSILKTKTPFLHIVRGLCVVVANMAFFLALAVVPLAEATALFFVAPLLITLLSIPILGEKVGLWRMGAVLTGFAGVIVMMRPWDSVPIEGGRWILALPVLGALGYAVMQVLTRKLGGTTKASAMAVYIQGIFLMVSSGFYLVAGDGRFAEGLENPSLLFLLRAWTWPQGNDIFLFGILGLCSAVVGYCLAQAYRSADAGLIAPFEYVGLPFAVFWGFVIWGELPDLTGTFGMALILGGGLLVFFREWQQQKRLATARQIKRRH